MCGIFSMHCWSMLCHSCLAWCVFCFDSLHNGIFENLLSDSKFYFIIFNKNIFRLTKNKEIAGIYKEKNMANFNFWDILRIGNVEEQEILKVIIIFLLVAILSSGGLFLFGQILANFSETRAKNDLNEMKKKYPVEDANKKYAQMRDDAFEDPFAVFKENPNKLKLASMYNPVISDTNNPVRFTIGSSMCMNENTGYIYINGGVKYKSPIDKSISVSSLSKTISKPHKNVFGTVLPESDPDEPILSPDVFVYSSCEREWLQYRSNIQAVDIDDSETFPVHRCYGCMEQIYSQLVLFGGMDENGKQSNKLYTYNMDITRELSSNNKGKHRYQGNWVELEVYNLNKPSYRGSYKPCPRSHCTMTKYYDCFVIFGGRGGDESNTLQNDVWMLHADSDKLYYEECYPGRDPELNKIPLQHGRASAKRVSFGDLPPSIYNPTNYTNFLLYYIKQTQCIYNKKTNTNSNNLNDLDVPTELPDLIPLPREAHCCSIIGELMIVFGGVTTCVVEETDEEGTTKRIRKPIPITVHEEGLLEIFDLTNHKWYAVNTCGDAPRGGLVGVSAHTLIDNGDNTGRLICFSACDTVTNHALEVEQFNSSSSSSSSSSSTKQKEFHVGCVFNTAFILDITRPSKVDGLGSLNSLLFTWTKFTYKWLGDWSILPCSRIFYSSSIDLGEGLLYIYGGYKGKNDSDCDMSIDDRRYNKPTGTKQAGPSTDGTRTEGDASNRNDIRSQRLGNLKRLGLNKHQEMLIGIKRYDSCAMSKQEWDEIAPLEDMCVVDISPLLIEGDARMEVTGSESSRQLEGKLCNDPSESNSTRFYDSSEYYQSINEVDEDGLDVDPVNQDDVDEIVSTDDELGEGSGQEESAGVEGTGGTGVIGDSGVARKYVKRDKKGRRVGNIVKADDGRMVREYYLSSDDDGDMGVVLGFRKTHKRATRGTNKPTHSL